MDEFTESLNWRGRRAALGAFLELHHGVASTTELRSLGFSSSSIDRLVGDGLLIRLSRGVYRGTGVPVSPDTALRGHLLRAGPRAAFALRSAGHLLGHLQFAPKIPQIVVAGRSGFAREADLERHAALNLTPGDLVTVRGLRCTSPFRTVIGLAGDAHNEGSLRVLRRVLRGAASVDELLVERLRETVDAAPFAGSRVLSRELRGGIAQTLVVRSSVEDRFVELCKRFKLPLPQTNAVVFGWELDAFWVDYGAFVEIDTFKTHGDEVAFERDREKFAALAARQLRGFAVTDRRIDFAPAEVAADVRGLLTLP